ncbi:MAG TPA: hypothetical protein VJL89_12050 [Thermodesulfovibrionia bacterium]|nr:hypothetical protein [Thermodesulfovibrionia bacterium]
MLKTNYFFERSEFDDSLIRKPYYLYKGYYTESEEKYPVILHFGRDEIVISYKDDKGRIYKVFSINVSEGELNQKELINKIEHYWNMPIWPLKRDISLKVDKDLISISYFTRIYPFDIMGEEFIELRLFAQKQNDFKISKDVIDFPKVETWALIDEEIYACKINFRKILLDLLFELEYTTTFEDENFLKLQPVLKNNMLIDAFLRKCHYLYELYHLREFERTKSNQNLPKKFINAEKTWLNACVHKSYLDLFTSEKSIFKTVEEEVELVIFKSFLGKRGKKRTDYFSKEDSAIRNQSATFFLRKYSLYNAFRILTPWILIIFPLLLLSILIHSNEVSFKLTEQSLTELKEDTIIRQLEKIKNQSFTDEKNFLEELKQLLEKDDFEKYKSKILKIARDEGTLNYFAGLSKILLPVILFFIAFIYYWYTGINLFKLIFPRLFLGILLGWSIFWSSSDLWKASLITNAGKIIILDLVLIVIIFLIIYTRIQNRLIRAKGSAFVKALHLLLFAMFISFIQGFYVLQFQAEPMLENSDFLKKDNARLFQPEPTEVDDKIKEINVNELAIRPIRKNEPSSTYPVYHTSKLQEPIMVEAKLNDVTLTVKKNNDDCDNNIECLKNQKDRKLYEINNYTSLTVWKNKEFKIYHIWSIHLSQFVMSILIGIIWLLIWEDRPITEPL